MIRLSCVEAERHVRLERGGALNIKLTHQYTHYV